VWVFPVAGVHGPNTDAVLMVRSEVKLTLLLSIHTEKTLVKFIRIEEPSLY